MRVLKEGDPGGPVSVALLGQSRYVLEGQLDALFAAVNKRPALTPFHATATVVGTP